MHVMLVSSHDIHHSNFLPIPMSSYPIAKWHCIVAHTTCGKKIKAVHYRDHASGDPMHVMSVLAF